MGDLSVTGLAVVLMVAAYFWPRGRR